MLKIIKDSNIIPPYSNYDNHILIDNITNSSNIEIKIDKNIKFFENGYKRWNTTGKTLVENSCIDINNFPIPPNIYNKNWHELKQFYVVDDNNDEVNAFIASLKLSKKNRLVYMVICDNYDNDNKTYYLSVKFLSCFGHELPISDDELETKNHDYSDILNMTGLDYCLNFGRSTDYVKLQNETTEVDLNSRTSLDILLGR